MVFRGYTAIANRTLAILLTRESENLGATGFSLWCAHRRLFLAYAVAGRTMEGRDDLEPELIDHIALKVDLTNDRVKGQRTLSGDYTCNCSVTSLIDFTPVGFQPLRQWLR